MGLSPHLDLFEQRLNKAIVLFSKTFGK